MASKNRWGKTNLDGYVTLTDPRFPGWTWTVMKAYQAPEKEKANPYARAFCRVVTPYTGSLGDMGDTYCAEIPGYFAARAKWEANADNELLAEAIFGESFRDR